jgi:hypothetical protein
MKPAENVKRITSTVARQEGICAKEGMSRFDTCGYIAENMPFAAKMSGMNSLHGDCKRVGAY